jgi:hypothetical protein
LLKFAIFKRGVEFMKKPALLTLFCAVLALLSCEVENGSIINYSSYTVSGETTKGMGFNLAPGKSKDHERIHDTIKRFSTVPAAAGVLYRYRGGDTEFYDTPALDLYVLNTHSLSYPIELSAQGLIEYMQDVSGTLELQPEPVTVPPGPFSLNPGPPEETLKIYTTKPVFTAYALDDPDPDVANRYPATVDWYYDAANNQIMVTVH